MVTAAVVKEAESSRGCVVTSQVLVVDGRRKNGEALGLFEDLREK